jgi:hypothetical protein
MKNLLLLIVAAVIVFFLWTKVLRPWLNKPADITGVSAATSGAAAAGGSSCAELAAKASEVWGSGIGGFANPPVDIANWDAFHSRVESAIGAADASCTSCSGDSCAKAREAVGNLRTLVSGFDSALRSGTGPPSDAPQQQEHIDQLIDQARELVRQGK